MTCKAKAPCHKAVHGERFRVGLILPSLKAEEWLDPPRKVGLSVNSPTRETVAAGQVT